MSNMKLLGLALGFAATSAFAQCPTPQLPLSAGDPSQPSVRPAIGGQTSSGYDRLVALFSDWRLFQSKPALLDGLPNYAPKAIADQQAALRGHQQRLAAIPTSGWTVPDQIDYRIVKAEMNGLDFELRVLRGWARDPGFYKIISAGHEATGFPGPIESPGYLKSPDDAAVLLRLTTLLRRVPAVFAQAKKNLTEGTPDQWRTGLSQVRGQQIQLADFRRAMIARHPELDRDFVAATAALDDFARWAQAKLPTLPDKPSGVGIEQFNWYLRNVQLVDMDWAEMLAVARREFDHYWTNLAVLENRFRNAPAIVPIPNEAAHKARYESVVKDYTDFLARERLRVVPRTEVATAMAAMRPYETPAQWRGYQTFEDRLAMRSFQLHEETHDGDHAYFVEKPPCSPIRRAPRLYWMGSDRTEGFAIAMEQEAVAAGYMDGRGKEAQYEGVTLIKASVNAIRNLMMVANRWRLGEAMAWAGKAVPYDWAPADAQSELNAAARTYSMPAVGSGYFSGSVAIKEIIATQRRTLGDRFDLKAANDAIMVSGSIPVSLIRWEITGVSPEQLPTSPFAFPRSATN